MDFYQLHPSASFNQDMSNELPLSPPSSINPIGLVIPAAFPQLLPGCPSLSCTRGLIYRAIGCWQLNGLVSFGVCLWWGTRVQMSLCDATLWIAMESSLLPKCNGQKGNSEHCSASVSSPWKSWSEKCRPLIYLSRVGNCQSSSPIFYLQGLERLKIVSTYNALGILTSL